jgi:hypothetical protein
MIHACVIVAEITKITFAVSVSIIFNYTVIFK